MQLFVKSELVPVVAQDETSGEVLMLGYANAEALRLTTETGKAWFFSRSRNKLWQKGETSGNFLTVSAIFADCDFDALIYHCKPHGPTCHTGEKSCFFNEIWRCDHA